MYFYIVLNGTKLPTPYLTLEEVLAAMDELEQKLCAPMITYVLE